MKRNLLLVLIVLFVSTITAQKVKFKKGIVTIDGIESFTYDKSPTVVELVSMDETQTIFLKYIRTGIGHNGGLYNEIIFVEQDKSFTIKSYIFTKKLLVKKLIKAKVVKKDGTIDASKIDKFILRYDEKIEDTLIRH